MTNFHKIFNQNTGIQKIVVNKTTDIDSDTWYDFTKDVCQQSTVPVDGMISFPNNDDLSPVNKHGKIMKRLKKHLKSTCGYSLDNSLMGVMGDLLQQYITKKSDTFYIDFTQDFNWRKGQFGNSDSCYWGLYSDSIPALESVGAWAIRFYKSEEQSNYNGKGRTWIVVMGDYIACFNSYGVSRQMTSKVIKEVFKNHGIELHYKRASIENSYNENIPYINGTEHEVTGGGFILAEDTNGFDHGDPVDLEIDWDSSEMRDCENCSHRAHYESDDWCYVNDSCYCSDCYCKNFRYCETCDSDIPIEEANDIQGQVHCDNCAKEHFTECYECEKYFDDDGVTWVSDYEEYYCEDCLEEHCTYCEVCEEWHHNICETSILQDEIEFTRKNHDITMAENHKVKVNENHTIYTTVLRLKGEANLFVYRNKDNYTVSHVTSNLAVKNGINELTEAVKLLKNLSYNFDCWNKKAEEIYSNDELMKRLREAVRS